MQYGACSSDITGPVRGNPQVVQALKPRFQKAEGHLDSSPCFAVRMVVGLLWWGLGVRKGSQDE